MTADQLSQLKKIREELDDIRGNEEEVKSLKSRIDTLINQGVDEAKEKIDALASFGDEDEDELPF